MNEYKIENIESFHKIFRVFRNHFPLGWWFRGQASILWELLPKAGRREYFLPNHRDLGRFNDWRKNAAAYSKSLPENDWECLALAQHHGLATRLLDWTYNPLVATYFAINSFYDIDGVIYCYDPIEFIDENFFSMKDEEKPSVYAYVPKLISPRILNQGGLFTVHSPANRQIESYPHKVWENHSNISSSVSPLI